MGGPQVSDLVLTTARALGRALDSALAAAGGSTPTWHVLRAVRTGEARSQVELAELLALLVENSAD